GKSSSHQNLQTRRAVPTRTSAREQFPPEPQPESSSNRKPQLEEQFHRNLSQKEQFPTGTLSQKKPSSSHRNLNQKSSSHWNLNQKSSSHRNLQPEEQFPPETQPEEQFSPANLNPRKSSSHREPQPEEQFPPRNSARRAVPTGKLSQKSSSHWNLSRKILTRTWPASPTTVRGGTVTRRPTWRRLPRRPGLLGGRQPSLPPRTAGLARAAHAEGSGRGGVPGLADGAAVSAAAAPPLEATPLPLLGTRRPGGTRLDVRQHQTATDQARMNSSAAAVEAAVAEEVLLKLRSRAGETEVVVRDLTAAIDGDSVR
uniref:Spermatogenesis associated 32 n=1 Tax=Macrostomum lignano TaxID=282301 RepID=A0A1I8IXI7_9PLAT